MSYVNLTVPSKVSDPSNSWVKRASALINDGYSAYSPAYATASPIILHGWEDSLPADAVITGITVNITSYGSTAGGSISVGLSRDAETIWGTAKSQALGTTNTTYTLGGSSDLWGLSELTLSSIKQNKSFGIYVVPATGSGYVNVDYISLVVTYTSNSNQYLRGNRSSFPRALDTIELAHNGTGGKNQVRTGDVSGTPPSPSINLLGDCLYNIEKTLVQQSDLVRSIGISGTGNLYLYTMTITGTVSGSVGWCNNGIAWETLLRNEGGVIKAAATIQSGNTFSGGSTTIQRTKECLPSKNLNFNFVSAIGWINNGGTVVPLSVSPKGYQVYSDNSGFGYYMGFTAVTLDAPLISSVTNDGYNSINVTFAVPTSGTFFVKLLAIGGEV